MKLIILQLDSKNIEISSLLVQDFRVWLSSQLLPYQHQSCRWYHPMFSLFGQVCLLKNNKVKINIGKCSWHLLVFLSLSLCLDPSSLHAQSYQLLQICTPKWHGRYSDQKSSSSIPTRSDVSLLVSQKTCSCWITCLPESQFSSFKVS